ncbi:MAG: hypothetical protein WC369_01740 [Dehalococcoidales bacterium]|jgi:hypothetical protein
MTIRLKSCPKCGGDVRVDRDHYGWFEQCIQCGHTHDMEVIAVNPRNDYQQKSDNWYQGNLELRPIIPFSLPTELDRVKKAKTLR